MTTEKLLFEIRKIIREELEIALSKKTSNTNIVTSSKLKETRIPKPSRKKIAVSKKRNLEEKNDIKEKLNAIKNLQKKFNVDLSDTDLNEEEPDIKEQFQPKTAAQKSVLDSLSKDYTKVLEKTGDIKK